MAVSAKLSSKFHETFGNEAAEEMVDWMQRVDAHQAELRSLNELNVSRYEATLGGRTAELRQEMLVGFAGLRQELHIGLAGLRQDTQAGLAELRQETQAGLAALRHEIHTIDTRVARVETRIGGLEARFDGLEARFRRPGGKVRRLPGEARRPGGKARCQPRPVRQARPAV